MYGAMVLPIELGRKARVVVPVERTMGRDEAPLSASFDFR